MATVKVVDLIVRAQTLLQDEDSTRWTVEELQYWLNDAYMELISLRPDSNTVVVDFACALGPRQSLATAYQDAFRLIEVVRNTAEGSSMKAVRLTDRRRLDDQLPSWYTTEPSINVEQYMFDPRVPKDFLVYPPATAATELEVIYASVPAAHELTAEELVNPATVETIRVDDVFSSALLDYILYRAFSKDAEQQAAMARAVAHYQAFQTALGTKQQANAASQPGVA